MKALRLYVMCAVLCCAAVDLGAHGVWFAQRSGELALVYGEGSEDLAIVPRLASVSGVAAYDASGASLATRLTPSGHLALVDIGHKPMVLTAVLDNGLWTVTKDDQEVNKGRADVPNAKESGHYLKYAVHLRGDLKKPLGVLPGQRLQLVPVRADLPKRMGDPLQLRALFDGKPLANAEVLSDFVNDPAATPLRTTGDGTLTVKVRNHGLNVISIVHDTPSDNPAQADKVQHRATLSFALPL
jgi:nickel transport protein